MLRLNRSTTIRTAPPVRIVHLGLGAFHRAHQAWYTQEANSATGTPWGIAAFTGRSPRAAELLRDQDGLYTLITRSAAGDHAEIIDSIVEANDGNDTRRWNELLASPDTAVVTLTVTEAGYRYRRETGLDYGDETVASDIGKLRQGQGAHAATSSVPGRLVQGLRARRDAGSGDIAILSCDNLSHNGEITRTVVLQMALAVDRDLAAWIDGHVSFVSSMVDRITPASTADDELLAAGQTGYRDLAPVVTEPFTEWIIAGKFPAGRPNWETAGAQFVEDIEPFEQRKLWLLNAGHSLLAYTGLLRGHATIAEAMGDDVCRKLLDQLWQDAAAVLPFSPDEVRSATDALRQRFGNPRIRHTLRQIAADGSQKIPLRCLPVIERRTHLGLDAGIGQAALLAAWLLHLRSSPSGVNDPGAADLVACLGHDLDEDARRLLSRLVPGNADLSALTRSVAEQAKQLSAAAGHDELLLKGTR